MAIDDLDLLRAQLPELFDDLALPDGWESDWAFTQVSQPERFEPVETIDLPADGGIEAILAGETSDEGSADGGGPAVPGFRDRFPGVPESFDRGGPPPPDAIAFYLPFHHFHPVWWGVYFVADGVRSLGQHLVQFSGGRLTMLEAITVARVFAYGHEAFHHQVECFATRLEVTHREPLYRIGFNALYKRTASGPDCIEEALASAHGYRRVKEIAFRKPNRAWKRRVALDALGEYIRRSPPGYNRALEFVDDDMFIHARNKFAESNQQECLPEIKSVGPDVWRLSPFAFAGISRSVSRVNYTVSRNSPLYSRLRATGLFLRYRDVTERLRDKAGCVFIRQNGGHAIWRSPTGQVFPVPCHPGDLARGTLRKIITQAGLDVSLSEFASGV